MEVGVDFKPILYGQAGASRVVTDFASYNSEQTTAGLYGSADTVFDGSFYTDSVKTMDDNRYSTKEIVQVKIDSPQGAFQIVEAPSVNTSTERGAGGSRWYKVKFSGNKPIALIGFQIHYETAAGIKQLNFAAGQASGAELIRNVMGL